MKKCCKQCGEAKLQSAYRTYYNGGTSHYKVCMDCEKINSRRKYLERKATRTTDEQDELLLIYQLYDAQRERGLAPPRQGKHEKGVIDLVAAQHSKLLKDCDELNKWLTVDMTGYTPDELYDIYEALKTKYKPVIGLDPETILPVYDETYGTVLAKILVRFDDYEEAYYDVE